MFHKLHATIMYTILSTVLVIVLNSCERSKIDYSPSIRPENIPSEALWVGEIDGGVYVLVTKSQNDKPELYDAIIYDSVGDIDYKGKIAINTIDNTKFNYTNVDSYTGWDGDTLYLRDGRFLKIFNNQK